MSTTTAHSPSVIPLADSIGVDLTGIDLRHRLPSNHLGLLKLAVAEHHVVVVRDQFLTARQHRHLAETFGPILASAAHTAMAPSIKRRAAVSTIEDNAQRPPAGFPWHTDLSWTPRPPSLGFLSAVVIPTSGGDTMWVSTAALFDKLSQTDQERCERSSLVHAPDASLLASVERHHGALVAERVRREHPGIEHPLVHAHPITGRRSLFLSPLYARQIAGPDGHHSEFLEHLYAMLDDPDMQMRWQWREGDLVIWDETATCHKALTDHHPQRRVMRRCVTGTS